ncbi:MAG: Fpg/Nei family DNA glycosylase [Miltoncostaeaceae bacterium]
MPEGHTIHRAARKQREVLAGDAVEASSPQGRFADGAALLDGRVLHDIEAYGKHLFYRFDEDLLLHVHLGLFGRFFTHKGDVPPPRGAIRLRLVGRDAAVDLRGPTACEVMDVDDESRLLARLGPDPLRSDAEPDRAWDRVSRSRREIGALVMDQSVMAGVGNVYRAEALHVLGIHPSREGRSLNRGEFDALWATVCRMLADGERAGRIVTVSAEDAGVPRSRIPRGERTYVYHQSSCRSCGGPVTSWDLAGRRSWACEACQG